MMSTQSTQLTSTQGTQHELLDQIQVLRAEIDNNQIQCQELKGVLHDVREEKQKVTVELTEAKGKMA